MIIIKTEMTVNGLTGPWITNFLLNCNEQIYQKWWKGTHLAFHTIRNTPNHIGDLVYMDEWIGKQRIKMKAFVANVIPGQKITWRMKALIQLPVWLLLDLEEIPGGVKISHAIHAGFKGIGSLLDPLFRLYFTADFAKAMDEHARIEFPKLKEFIH